MQWKLPVIYEGDPNKTFKKREGMESQLSISYSKARVPLLGVGDFQLSFGPREFMEIPKQ